MQEKHSEPTALAYSTGPNHRLGAAMSSSWRGLLDVHPAANNIPEASDDERRGIAVDLAKHRLADPRLAAMPPRELNLQLADLRGDIAHRLQRYAAGFAPDVRLKIDDELQALASEATL